MTRHPVRSGVGCGRSTGGRAVTWVALSLTIRTMADADVTAVCDLMLRNYDGEIAAHHSPSAVARFRSMVRPEWLREDARLKRVFVAEDERGIVATGALADFGQPGEPRYCVSQFFVRDDLHRQGIGALLMQHLLAVARRKRMERLHVPSSRNAVAFYKSEGFRVDAAQPDEENEITWMTLELAPKPPGPRSPS